MKISLIVSSIWSIIIQSEASTLKIDHFNNVSNPDLSVSSLIIEHLNDEIITIANLMKYPNLKMLSIRSSRIDDMEDGSLCFPGNLTSLKFLYNTKIPKFTNETFRGCTNLEELYIDGAARIEKGVFGHLGHLKTLKITDAILPRVLDEEFFKGLGDSLRNVDIKYSNVEELVTDTFKDLGNLKFLSLSYNKLKVLPKRVFSQLVGLKTLDLSGNRMENIDLDVFQNLKSLQILFLDSNEFKKFEFGLMRVLPHLERVFFDRKRLSPDELLDTSSKLSENNVTIIWTGQE